MVNIVMYKFNKKNTQQVNDFKVFKPNGDTY